MVIFGVLKIIVVALRCAASLRVLVRWFRPSLTVRYIDKRKIPLEDVGILKGDFYKLDFAVVNFGLVVEGNEAVFLGGVV